jgi:hypothetical protein
MQLKFLATVSAGFVFLIFCLHGTLQAAQQSADISLLPPEEAQLHEDLASLQQLVEEALAWRLEARGMFVEFEAKIDNDIPLSHAEIELIHTGSNYYLAMREKILVYAHKYKKYVATTNHVQFAPGKGTRTTLEEDVGYDDYYTKFRIDPEDAEGMLILDRIKLSLAASLVLYDNYLVAIYPYQENSKLRKLINFDNLKASRKLDAVTLNYLSLGYRGMVRKAIRLFEKDLLWRKKQNMGEGYLDILISGSLSYEDIRKNNLLSTTAQLGESVSRIFQDNVNKFSKESMNIISGLFGNTLGLIEMRKGKLKKLSKQELQEIGEQLEPLDILLEKTPFRLTDKFIPGYYGHVAVWVGGPEDWEKEGLDVLDDPVVKKHLAKISKDKKVVEALRQGVKLNTLAHFMNIDDLVILRHRELNKERKKEYLLRALTQVGKKYDFNFDVETDKKIVCSEIAYVVFHDVNWQTEKSIGRFTISPDNVARMALENGPFEVIELYHDGKRVKKDQEQYFATLLAGNK